MVAFYNLMLCETNLCKEVVLHRSCKSVSLWCLGQSPQILWGRNKEQSPSWDHCSAVEGQLNAALLWSGPGGEA